MLKCTHADGSIRYINKDIIHSIVKDQTSGEMAVTITKPGSSETTRIKISSFQLVKSGTTYKC